MEQNIKKKSRISRAQLKSDFNLTLLALPGIILLIIFCYIPMFGIIIAFKDYSFANGILGSDWIGFKNFEFFFTSQDAWRITRNTVGYGALFIIVEMVAQVGLALVLYEITSKKALKAYQTSMILPNFMSWVIVGYISYVFLNPNAGVLNGIIRAFGGKGVEWYNEMLAWPFILTVFRVWKSVGMGSLYYYSALMGIDAALFEAAKIDGASKWKQIIHISIPSITPTICILLIMHVGTIIKGDFGLFYQIPRDVGILYPVTDIIDTYVFRSVRNGSFAISAAVGFFQSFVGLFMVICTNAIVKKINSDNSMF